MSQGEPKPSAERLSLLVADALRLWVDIPTTSLVEAVDEALIAAGNFPLKVGAVAKAWREKAVPESRFLGAGRMNQKETMQYIANMTEPEITPGTPEWREFWSGLAEKALGGEQKMGVVA